MGIILLQHSTPQSLSLVGTPISQTLYSYLSGVSDSTLNMVGSGQVSSLTPESGSALTSNGKPEFLYIGADYCPYCAAERWGIIVGLSRFGSFSGLEYMLSADSPEIYPNTSTFTFSQSTYSSQYIGFVSVETQDRAHHTLQTPTSAENTLMQQYDPSSGIPFIDIANRYVYSGSQYTPAAISGLNWTQIGSQLNDPNSGIAKAIDGTANTLITAICKADGGSPSSVCGQSYATVFEPPFPSQQPPGNFLNTLLATDGGILKLGQPI